MNPYQATSPAVPAVKKKSARKGAAITALVLGIVAACGSPIPILNNATILAGVIGVVFAVIALFGRHLIMATFGGVLAVAGIVIGIALQVYWGQQLDQIGKNLSSGSTPAPSYHYAGSAPTSSTPPPIQRGDFTIGLKTVSKQCFGYGYGCNLVVEPTISYAGSADRLSSYGTCTITYSITGNKDGEITDTAYGQGGGQYRVMRSVLTTASAQVTPQASVTDVSCS
jgi:hypothetical protein